MQPKTLTTLSTLRIGDSFVYPKRIDPWRVMARADKNGRVAVNQIGQDRKPIWKYDELKKGSTQVVFVRHTVPVPGEQFLLDDLSEGDVFKMVDDDATEYILVKKSYPWCDVSRVGVAEKIKGGIMAAVIFIKKGA